MLGGELKGKLALVVEDDTDYAAFLAECLREGGLDVEVALDADQALQKIAQHKPDIITLDIQMPRESGLLFFRRIRSMERFREIPVVVVTGLTADGSEMTHILHTFLEKDGIRAPSAYLEKPVSAHQLMETVTSVLSEIAPSDGIVITSL